MKMFDFFDIYMDEHILILDVDLVMVYENV